MTSFVLIRVAEVRVGGYFGGEPGDEDKFLAAISDAELRLDVPP